MKKILSVIWVVLLASVLFGCTEKPEVSNVPEDGTNDRNNEKIKIVTTLFPQYDFARQIAGDKGEIVLLLPPGADSHSFEPTPSDIIIINNSDIFIYTGKYMEAWADKIIQSADNDAIHNSCKR